MFSNMLSPLWRFAYWIILHAFLSSADFSKSTFSKKILGVANSLDPDQVLSGLIWVQVVCKGYQQTALVGKSFESRRCFLCTPKT